MILIYIILFVLMIKGCHKEELITNSNDEKFTFLFHKDKFAVELGGGFVGSEKCRECHIKEYRSWEKTKHAKSYNTLIHI
ncbi:cytochrome c family protein, partial [bacterium]|nr:cytochrome c family protein [bacterium]